MRMHRSTLAMCLLLALCAVSPAQFDLIPINGGSGADGSFNPAANTILDTDAAPNFGVYNFTDMTIGLGIMVTSIGSNSLVIKVQGNVIIDGVLNCSGAAGGSSTNNAIGGLGGAGGPGAGSGGEGGCGPSLGGLAGSGNPGTGASPGQPGVDLGVLAGSFTESVGGGGGGGNATAGAMGGPPNSASVLGNASGAGGPAVAACRAGSGGGGGGCDLDDGVVLTNNDGGAGGGGGGGQVCIFSDTSIVVNGSITANGGAGGINAGNGGAGGGGSGGSIDLAAPSVAVSGTVSATGGAGGPATQGNCGCSPGGAGGNGCIEICGTLTNTGSVTPVPLTQRHCLMLIPTCPNGSCAAIGVAGQSYVAAVSATLGPPIPIGGPRPFELSVIDQLFALTFPVNTLSPIFANATGLIGGTVDVNLNGVVPLGSDFTIYLQGVSLNAGAISGVSDVVPVRIKF